MTETSAPILADPGAVRPANAELDHLRGPGRAEIVKRIEAAREEGDLKENGGYHAAKDEQGKQEARIRQLSSCWRTRRVGETPPRRGRRGPGMVVTAEVAGDERSSCSARGRGLAGDVDVYSPTSPLGHAIIGHRSASHDRTPRPTASRSSS